MNAERWAGDRTTERAGDTAAQIADAPTPVAWFRRGTPVGSLTVRVEAALRAGDPQAQSIGGSASRGAVTIIAPDDTDLRVDDTLQAGGGTVYAITFVYPRQIGRTAARAEVLSQ